MYRLNEKPQKKHEGAEKWKAHFTMPNPMGEVRMLSVDPQCGIKMVGRYSDEAFDIFSDDDEAIFYLQPDNIFLSCLTSDLIRVGKRVYLMGDAVAYKLNREDDYADMSSDEMAETCLELMERMQRVRIGQFCFSVIDLTDEIKEDRGSMKKNNRNAAARAAVTKQDMNRQNNTVRRMMAYQERMVKKPCRKKLKTGQ